MSSAPFIQENIALWEKFIAPNLGKTEARQFIQASTKGQRQFADRFINDQLFHPDNAGAGTYIPVDIETHTPGRNHLLAESLAANRSVYSHLDADPAICLTYFTNALKIGKQIVDPLTGESVWERPSERVVMGDLHAFTFEFDINDPTFLKLQLSWLRSPKNPLDCPVGTLYQHLAQFADFAGITVNYSGNKSLHFHLVFDTRMAVDQLGLAAATDVRHGLMSHWDALLPVVLDRLGVRSGITADASLRLPEAYRRVPNGTRVLEKAGHILGIPAGTFVPQVTLWEKWRERAAPGADALFFKPEPFFTGAIFGRARGASNNPTRGLAGKTVPEMLDQLQADRDRVGRTKPRFRKVLTADEMSYCEAKLRAFYPGYPKFEHLAVEGRHWVARFSNSPADRTPSSIMREDHRAVMLVGRDAAGLSPRKLSHDLGVMIRGWVAEFNRPKLPEWQEVDWTVEPVRITPPRPHEIAFSQAATDYEAAARAVRKVIRSAALSNACSLISAPEGIRKTSSLFADHHRIQGALQAQTGAVASMYAFADYKAAEQKCADFNAAQEGRRHSGSAYYGVVLPSFSKAYEQACDALGWMPLTEEDAAGLDCPNLWTAVADHHSEVLDLFKSRNKAMWAEINGRRPVFFTVHDVAQKWKLTTPTRVMWARDFWIGRMEDNLHVRDCRRSLNLGLLVHDEVVADNLVALYRAEVLDWVDGLRTGDPKVWGGHRAALHHQVESFKRYAAVTPMPIIAGSVCPISFNEAREIVGLGRVDWDAVTTQWSGEYQAPDADREATDIYADRMGRRWRVAPKGWWQGVAERVVVLTTEAVPTAVARRIDLGWTILELDTPLLERHCVDVHPQRGVTGPKLLNVVKRYRSTPEASSRTIISNKVKALANTVTHMAARGSNDYIGQDLAQTMTFLTPDEVEKLEALNAWTGHDCQTASNRDPRSAPKRDPLDAGVCNRPAA
jgi:hypothetical protein